MFVNKINLYISISLTKFNITAGGEGNWTERKISVYLTEKKNIIK